MLLSKQPGDTGIFATATSSQVRLYYVLDRVFPLVSGGTAAAATASAAAVAGTASPSRARGGGPSAGDIPPDLLPYLAGAPSCVPREHLRTLCRLSAMGGLGDFATTAAAAAAAAAGGVRSGAGGGGGRYADLHSLPTPLAAASSSYAYPLPPRQDVASTFHWGPSLLPFHTVLCAGGGGGGSGGDVFGDEWRPPTARGLQHRAASQDALTPTLAPTAAPSVFAEDGAGVGPSAGAYGYGGGGVGGYASPPRHAGTGAAATGAPRAGSTVSGYAPSAAAAAGAPTALSLSCATDRVLFFVANAEGHCWIGRSDATALSPLRVTSALETRRRMLGAFAGLSGGGGGAGTATSSTPRPPRPFSGGAGVLPNTSFPTHSIASSERAATPPSASVRQAALSDEDDEDGGVDEVDAGAGGGGAPATHGRRRRQGGQRGSHRDSATAAAAPPSFTDGLDVDGPAAPAAVMGLPIGRPTSHRDRLVTASGWDPRNAAILALGRQSGAVQLLDVEYVMGSMESTCCSSTTTSRGGSDDDTVEPLFVPTASGVAGGIRSAGSPGNRHLPYSGVDHLSYSVIQQKAMQGPVSALDWMPQSHLTVVAARRRDGLGFYAELLDLRASHDGVTYLGAPPEVFAVPVYARGGHDGAAPCVLCSAEQVACHPSQRYVATVGTLRMRDIVQLWDVRMAARPVEHHVYTRAGYTSLCWSGSEPGVVLGTTRDGALRTHAFKEFAAASRDGRNGSGAAGALGSALASHHFPGSSANLQQTSVRGGGGGRSRRRRTVTSHANSIGAAQHLRGGSDVDGADRWGVGGHGNAGTSGCSGTEAEAEDDFLDDSVSFRSGFSGDGAGTTPSSITDGSNALVHVNVRAQSALKCRLPARVPAAAVGWVCHPLAVSGKAAGATAAAAVGAPRLSGTGLSAGRRASGGEAALLGAHGADHLPPTSRRGLHGTGQRGARGQAGLEDGRAAGGFGHGADIAGDAAAATAAAEDDDRGHGGGRGADGVAVMARGCRTDLPQVLLLNAKNGELYTQVHNPRGSTVTILNSSTAFVAAGPNAFLTHASTAYKTASYVHEEAVLDQLAGQAAAVPIATLSSGDGDAGMAAGAGARGHGPGAGHRSGPIPVARGSGGSGASAAAAPAVGVGSGAMAATTSAVSGGAAAAAAALASKAGHAGENGSGGGSGAGDAVQASSTSSSATGGGGGGAATTARLNGRPVDLIGLGLLDEEDEEEYEEDAEEARGGSDAEAPRRGTAAALRGVAHNATTAAGVASSTPPATGVPGRPPGAAAAAPAGGGAVLAARSVSGLAAVTSAALPPHTDALSSRGGTTNVRPPLQEGALDRRVEARSPGTMSTTTASAGTVAGSAHSRSLSPSPLAITGTHQASFVASASGAGGAVAGAAGVGGRSATAATAAAAAAAAAAAFASIPQELSFCEFHRLERTRHLWRRLRGGFACDPLRNLLVLLREGVDREAYAAFLYGCCAAQLLFPAAVVTAGLPAPRSALPENKAPAGMPTAAIANAFSFVLGAKCVVPGLLELLVSERGLRQQLGLSDACLSARFRLSQHHHQLAAAAASASGSPTPAAGAAAAHAAGLTAYVPAGPPAGFGALGLQAAPMLPRAMDRPTGPPVFPLNPFSAAAAGLRGARPPPPATRTAGGAQPGLAAPAGAARAPHGGCGGGSGNNGQRPTYPAAIGMLRLLTLQSMGWTAPPTSCLVDRPRGASPERGSAAASASTSAASARRTHHRHGSAVHPAERFFVQGDGIGQHSLQEALERRVAVLVFLDEFEAAAELLALHSGHNAQYPSIALTLSAARGRQTALMSLAAADCPGVTFWVHLTLTYVELVIQKQACCPDDADTDDAAESESRTAERVGRFTRLFTLVEQRRVVLRLLERYPRLGLADKIALATALLLPVRYHSGHLANLIEVLQALVQQQYRASLVPSSGVPAGSAGGSGAPTAHSTAAGFPSSSSPPPPRADAKRATLPPPLLASPSSASPSALPGPPPSTSAPAPHLGGGSPSTLGHRFPSPTPTGAAHARGDSQDSSRSDSALALASTAAAAADRFAPLSGCSLLLVTAVEGVSADCAALQRYVDETGDVQTAFGYAAAFGNMSSSTVRGWREAYRRLLNDQGLAMWRSQHDLQCVKLLRAREDAERLGSLAAAAAATTAAASLDGGAVAGVAGPSAEFGGPGGGAAGGGGGGGGLGTVAGLAGFIGSGGAGLSAGGSGGGGGGVGVRGDLTAGGGVGGAAVPPGAAAAALLGAGVPRPKGFPGGLGALGGDLGAAPGGASAAAMMSTQTAMMMERTLNRFAQTTGASAATGDRDRALMREAAAAKTASAAAAAGGAGPAGGELLWRSVELRCNCGQAMHATAPSKSSISAMASTNMTRKQLIPCGNPECRQWQTPMCTVCGERMEHRATELPPDRFFAWCSVCLHGGHWCHLREWFSKHTKCAVENCPCHCCDKAHLS